MATSGHNVSAPCKGFGDIVGGLYDALLHEERWHDALLDMSADLGANGVFHIVANPVTGMIAQSHGLGVDPQVNLQYLAYYANKEIRLAPCLGRPIGVISTERSLLDSRELKRSEIFADLLEPYDIPHIMQTWLRKEPAAFETIVIEGGAAHGEFEEADQNRLRQFLPHLIRVCELRSRFGSMRALNAAQQVVIDALPFGVVVLDSLGLVTRANTRAESLLQAGSVLTQRSRRVSAAMRSDDEQLQKAIHCCLARPLNASPAANSLTLRRPNGRPVLATLIPILSAELLSWSPTPAAIVLTVDLQETPVPRVREIQKTFRLTAAEARLANTLFQGSTLSEAALTLGVSINTCKTQLKSVYAKTGCKSHAELAKNMLLVAIAQHEPKT